MHLFKLNDELFWEWGSLSSNGLSKDSALGILDNALNNGSIDRSFLMNGSIQLPNCEHSDVVAKLRDCVPRKYFEELYYCASLYTSIFGRILPSMVSFVDELLYIEWLLYTEPENPRYRDHLVHMFKVAFTSCRFLSSKEFVRKMIERQLTSEHFIGWAQKNDVPIFKWELPTIEKIVRISCFFSAIFHDFGYGHLFLGKYKNRILRFCDWLMPANDIGVVECTARTKLLSSLPAHYVRTHHHWQSTRNDGKVCDAVVSSFFQDTLQLNHSTASALFVLRLCETLSEVGAITQELYVAFQLAAEACMIHDMTGNTNWAHLCPAHDGSNHFLDADCFEDSPLAALLILSDELSAWNRPRLLYEQVEHDGRTGIFARLDRDSSLSEVQVNIFETPDLVAGRLRGVPRIEISPLARDVRVETDFIDGLKKMPCFKDASSGSTNSFFGYRLCFSNGTSSTLSSKRDVTK